MPASRCVKCGLLLKAPSATQAQRLCEHEFSKIGFAVLSPEAVRVLARKGNVAMRAAGTAHKFTSEEARAAGRKGGLATHANKRNISEG